MTAADEAITTPSLGAGGIFVTRIYLRFATLPIIDAVIIAGSAPASTSFPALLFKASDSKLYAGSSTNLDVLTFGATGAAVTTNTWYLIDYRHNLTSNPWTVDAQVDASAVGQATVALAANSAGNNIQVGFPGTAVTGDIYLDDWLITRTSADYPIGAGFVNHFVPTSDGTHNVAGAADFRRGDTTTDITNATTTAYQLVDEVPGDDATPDTDDHIRIVAPPNVTDYVEVVFGPAPGVSTPAVAPRAVEVIGEVFAAGTGLSDEIIRLNDNGTVDIVYDGTGLAGETSGNYKRKHYATAPTGGAWTVAAGAGNFNNIRLRYGYATDANPDKSLMCAMIEAEFAPAAAGARRRQHVIEEE